MKFIKFTLVLFSLTLLIIACTETKTNNTNVATNTIVITNTTAQPTAASDEFAEARKIFSESCVGCHRANGEGGEKDFEGTKIKVPSYKSKGAMAA
ncbi:MAG: cytochrome c, partial [Acidobacteriota bacterium]|nr:cytochrome c [Acidobacteriota bacterium]